jgi:hypothetical protein
MVKISTPSAPSAVPCIAVFTKTTSDVGCVIAHSVMTSILKKCSQSNCGVIYFMYSILHRNWDSDFFFQIQLAIGQKNVSLWFWKKRLYDIPLLPGILRHHLIDFETQKMKKFLQVSRILV